MTVPTDPSQTKPLRFGGFIAELGRRHVGRIAIAYAAVAFVLLQTGEIILPAFNAPEWGLRLLVVLVLLGLPIAVALAWVYDITSHGIRRTADLAPAAPGQPRPGRLMPRLAFLGLTLATVAATGWWVVRWSVSEDGTDAPPAPPAVSTVSTEPGGGGGAIHSIAVLPLQNFSAEGGEQDYFTAGMLEAVIHQLSQIEALRVVSRTSVGRYADTDKTIPEIARELDVEAIVEGSVLRDGDRVRITVQLIHGPSDTHLWSKSYERELKDIIALQREVAEDIAREIRAEITPADETRLAMMTPVDPEATDAYMRGRYEQSKGTPEGWEAAVGFYEEAVEIDSSFAFAYEGLAGSQFMLGAADSVEFVHVLPIVVAALEKALILNPESPEAQAVVVEVTKRLAKLDSLGERVTEFTVSLDSLSIQNEEWLATFTEFGNQVQRSAIRWEGRSRPSADPARQIAAARRLAAAGDHEAAEALLEELVATDPSPMAWHALEMHHAARHDYSAIVEVRRRRLASDGGNPEEEAAVAALERAITDEGALGYWAWQRRELGEMEARGEPVSQVALAATAVVLGDYDEAFARLEAAFDAREPGMLSLRGDFPLWDPIRADPRFADLRRRVRQTRWPHPTPRGRR